MSEINIRESLRRFPAVTQPFWTWLTGKALPGEQPLFRVGPWTYLATTLLTFFTGLVLASWALLRTPPVYGVWLVLGWALTLNGARNMAVVLVHQCGHSRFTKNPQIDQFVGQCLSTLLLSQDVVSYRHDHAYLHHGANTFTTERDPVLVFIRRFGFREGMSRRQLWLHTVKTLVSPVFHAGYLSSRLKNNLWLARGPRLLAAWAHVALWALVVLGVPGGWKVFLGAFAVPVFFLYHQSAFLELLTEHAWFIPRRPGESVREHLSTRSWGRFCASRPPSDALPLARRWAAWAGWWCTMLLYHLPMRFLVLVGDAPQHDFHHRHPGSLEWTSPSHARQADIDAGHKGWPAYWDVWGYHTALNLVFDALSGAPVTPGGRPSTPPAQAPGSRTAATT